MKIKFKYFLIPLIIIILIIAYLLFTNKIFPKDNEIELTQAELVNKIIPEMENYCKDLQSKAINSACPTCKFSDITACNLIQGELGTSMGDECTIKEQGENYIIQAKRDLIYGRNDRPGTVILTFTISSNGKILSKDLPEKNCV